MTSRRLGLDDIADARAYEREREEFRARIIALKKLRRIPLGPVVSVVFENRDTIRFQVQEMARAERIYTDEGIQGELDTYNPLIPEPGSLSASLYIELTSKAQMEEWLPKLVGIERAVALSLESHLAAGPTGGNGAAKHSEMVRCDVEQDHAAALTRQDVTAAVHFVQFTLTSAQIDSFREGPVALVTDHPEYTQRTLLGDETRRSLLQDLLP